jgi:nicotinate dehydrogenase subunit A
VTSVSDVRINVVINDVRHALAIDGNALLIDVLRDTLKLKGTRFGCGASQCGACFVLVDGFAVASCDLPMWAVENKSVTSVEGLGDVDAPHALQRAFIDEQAAQCGYCTAGMLISAAALLQRCPRPSEADVREALDRNLCRCGTHNRVIRAVLRASGP